MNINLFHTTHFAMNTRMDLVFWGQEMPVQQQASNEIREEVKRLELILSRFDEQAETYRLNQHAYQQEVRMSQELWDILQQCLSYRQFTNGYFDVFFRRSGSEEKAPFQLNSQQRGIQFNEPKLQLDFGGIGKGITLAQIQFILESRGIKNALVSFGESSVLALGKHPHGNYWPFAFQDEHRIGESIPLSNSSLSISGLHQNQAHIFDPHTNMLSPNTETICVQSDNPIEAEVLSTALIAAPKKAHEGICARFETKQVIYSNTSNTVPETK